MPTTRPSRAIKCGICGALRSARVHIACPEHKRWLKAVYAWDPSTVYSGPEDCRHTEHHEYRTPTSIERQKKLTREILDELIAEEQAAKLASAIKRA
jgi:hypothetical protein